MCLKVSKQFFVHKNDQEMKLIYKSTYNDANCEDCRETRNICTVVFYEQDLFGDPGVSHSVEYCHANPEPDVEGC